MSLLGIWAALGFPAPALTRAWCARIWNDGARGRAPSPLSLLGTHLLPG